MSLQAAIRTILRSDANVLATVGDRVRPDQLNKGDTLPAIIVELESRDGLETLDDATGDESDCSFVVVCCGSTRSAASALETLVRNALDGYRGTANGFSFRPISYVSTDYDHEPPEDGGEGDSWYLNEVQFDAFVEEV